VKVTAFVSHYDCSRHDTGWGNPDHQGRLPGLMRAVYADMLTLFEPLLEVEGRHATVAELERVHSRSYLDRVRSWVAQATAVGGPVTVGPTLVASAASWEASLAAVGCALTGIQAVVDGRSRNAFCAVRPPGRDATADAPGAFGFLNPVAAAVAHLLSLGIADRVLVVEWGESCTSLAQVHTSNVRVVGVGDLADDADGETFLSSTADALARGVEGCAPEFVILSAGFDWLAGDPVAGRNLLPRDYYAATELVRKLSERECSGRLVSILEGGYDARLLGVAGVQHLRALAGLPRAV